jgi:hypothetical protein
MTSAKISVLNSQDMVKLRNTLSFIPIQTTEIKQNLDSYKEVLQYKTEFINKYHYNTSLSPEMNEKKQLISSTAKQWQDDLTSIYKTKLKKKAASLIERVKEQGEFESSFYDSIILKNLIQKMKVDEITRRIGIESFKAKIQMFNSNKLKKKVEKEVLIKKFKEKEKVSNWNKINQYRKVTNESVLNNKRKSISGFEFVTA